jgi:hypothetical protein
MLSTGLHFASESTHPFDDRLVVALGDQAPLALGAFIGRPLASSPHLGVSVREFRHPTTLVGLATRVRASQAPAIASEPPLPR